MEKAGTENSDCDKLRMNEVEKEGNDSHKYVKVKEEMIDDGYKMTVKHEVLEENGFKAKCEKIAEDTEKNGCSGTIAQIKEEQDPLDEPEFCYVNCLDYHSQESNSMQVYNVSNTEQNNMQNREAMGNEPLQFVKVEMPDNCDKKFATEYETNENDFKMFGESANVDDIKKEISDTTKHDAFAQDTVDADERDSETEKGIDESSNSNSSCKRQHTCGICNRKFNHRCNLSRHRQTHSTDLLFSCEVCGKMFKMKHYLSRHMRIHGNKYPYVCEVCNKSFLDKCLLTRHYNIHTGERPFVCEICGKGFIRKFNLMQHEVTHATERLFTCEVCNKGFKFKSNLVQHGRIHTNERPFTCDICGIRFRFKSDCRRHLKKKHDKKFSSENITPVDNDVTGVL